jgi:multiple sugar transport system permease protein
MKAPVNWTRTPYYVLTGGLAIIFLFPLVWSAVASVSPQPATGQVTGSGFGNYLTLLDFQAGLGTFLLNSTIISAVTVAVTLVVSVLGGYAFANFAFPGKNILFLGTLAILMVPYATLLIPLYVLLRTIGLQDSLVGLSLVLAMYQLPFATFMMRISFESVPRELEESALVDGCTPLQALIRIVLPLSVPGIVAAGLFVFIASWNNFLFAFMLTAGEEVRTLPVVTRFFVQGEADFPWGTIMASAVMTTLPVALLFLFFQRYLIRGLTAGSVKG